jgi:hypothetical protein
MTNDKFSMKDFQFRRSPLVAASTALCLQAFASDPPRSSVATGSSQIKVNQGEK